MSFMNARVECASSASELRGSVNDWLSIMITQADVFADSCADPATKYLVTFEMTIKPLPEEPSISGSHPLTDGLGE